MHKKRAALAAGEGGGATAAAASGSGPQPDAQAAATGNGDFVSGSVAAAVLHFGTLSQPTDPKDTGTPRL